MSSAWLSALRSSSIVNCASIVLELSAGTSRWQRGMHAHSWGIGASCVESGTLCCLMDAVRMGLEEEVFLTEPMRPHLDSLYYMARLLIRNPRHYYRHSASNFARGKDIRYGLMSTVEIATTPHMAPEALLEEFRLRRRELSEVVDSAYIVPVGHLFDSETPTNTGGLHLHVGVVPERRSQVYANLAHFLPLLMLLTVSSPYAGGRYFGQSYRIAHSFAIGPLREDPTYRFQDLIITRRLGTVEIRVLDPVWDYERVWWVLRAVRTIVDIPRTYPLDRDRYRELREQACRAGYTRDLRAIYRELCSWITIPERLFQETVSDRLAEWVGRYGMLATYASLDYAYRTGVWQYCSPRRVAPSVWRACAGIAGYYLLRLPYTAYKAWAEWHG